jgi:hypothetical protein
LIARYTSEKLEGVILLGNIVDALAALDGGAGFPFQLDWHPIRPGSFSIPEAGIYDDRRGALVGVDGPIGRIDYRTGSGAIQMTAALAVREKWSATFEYDPDAAIAALDFEIVATTIAPSVRKLSGPR